MNLLNMCIGLAWGCTGVLLVTGGAASADISSYAGKGRGEVWEYDPGPPKDSRWPELFASTPNYRAIGKAVLGGRGEKFRWTFGPMYYRGRLTPGSVKVFVVGQEGAQDESLSNRAFTGSTGTKMQNFLNHIGITQSYLFMNTFVYTIFDQYTDGGTVSPKMAWLAQSVESPVVRHRHAMFDYMLETNRDTLALVIGVGVAGKDSVVTWVRSHWGPELGPRKCPYIDRCDGSILGPNVKVMGVVHPGGANPRLGGSSAFNSLMRSFNSASAKVAAWAAEDPEWLPSDPDSSARIVRTSKGPAFRPGFYYRNSGVPHRDFAFGTTWVLGKDGTSSNRKTQQAIQIYSSNGCYNNTQKDERDRCLHDSADSIAPRERLSYSKPKDLTRFIEGMPKGEIEWEFPRLDPTDYDSGPGKMARLLMGQERGYEWPDFSKLGVTAHLSLGTGPIYRGRLEEARVLILADQASHDDLFTTRALTGEGGQRLQSFLESLGITSSYAIIRTLPVDTLDLSARQVERIASHPQAVKVRNRILESILAKGKTRLVLAVGEHAGKAIDSTRTGELPVVKLDSVGERGYVSQWNSALQEVRGQVRLARDRGAAADYEYDGEISPIPRKDLPVHTKWWVGTSGSRGSRAYNPKLKALDGNYYKFTMPYWVYRLPAKRMTSDELRSIRTAP